MCVYAGQKRSAPFLSVKEAGPNGECFKGESWHTVTELDFTILPWLENLYPRPGGLSRQGDQCRDLTLVGYFSNCVKLNPFTVLRNRSTSEARMDDLLLLLHELNRVSSDIADAAKTQFSALCAIATSAFKEEFKQQFTRDVDLCKFYADLRVQGDRLKERWTAVKLVMNFFGEGYTPIER